MLILFHMLVALQGQPAALGARVTDLPPAVAASSAIYNLRGAVVTALQPGAAAERAGVRVNDIITSIGNETVNAAGDISLIMTLHKQGDAVTITVVRPGAALPWPKIALKATLGSSASLPGPSADRPAASNVTAMAAAQSPRPARSISNTGAVAVQLKQSKRCYALAPADWSIDSRDIGDAADLKSSDGRIYAGWIIHGVERLQERFQGELFGDPPTSARATIDAIGQLTGMRGRYQYIGQPQQVGAGFVAQELQAPGYRAMVIYKVYPPAFGMSQGSYIISLRMALAPADGPANGLNTAVGVSASINCNVGLEVHNNGNTELPRPGDVFDKRRKSEANDLTDYNSQLGTQYAHSPSTGQNYLLDRATQWNDHGPDGPGYYRQVGNTTEKLVPGIQ